MSLPMGVQARYWGAAALLFLVSLWFMGSVMLPFLVGGAIAYFLDPVADRLERLGMNRVAATSLISVLALVAVVLLVLAVIPTLVKQTTALINTAPEMVARLVAFLTERFPDLLDETSTVRQTLSDLGKSIQTGGAAVLQGLLSSALGLISALIFVVVVPVVAFYLLLDWDHMVARIDMLLPRDHAPVIRVLASEIDRTLAAFVRGQLSVCLVLGAYYSIGMIAVGLQFGLLVGAAAGAITFIPYIGALFGGALALGLALFQFWGDWLSIGLVALVFGVGQFLEGNVLTPRMVGKSVGLHPVWLMFALSVFGAAFGFVGLLVAVPVAASIGVLTRFFMGQYQASALYVGVVGRIPEDEDQA
jgi:predicted PurR-regulated permease PerM